MAGWQESAGFISSGAALLLVACPSSDGCASTEGMCGGVLEGALSLFFLRSGDPINRSLDDTSSNVDDALSPPSGMF